MTISFSNVSLRPRQAYKHMPDVRRLKCEVKVRRAVKASKCPEIGTNPQCPWGIRVNSRGMQTGLLQASNEPCLGFQSRALCGGLASSRLFCWKTFDKTSQTSSNLDPSRSNSYAETSSRSAHLLAFVGVCTGVQPDRRRTLRQTWFPAPDELRR